MRAVVFVHYRLPLPRLVDHFRWNADAYIDQEAEVYVVTDRDIPAPPWVNILPYPKPLAVFSLTKTANYGIRKALDDGAEVVCKTDADIVFPVDSLAECFAVGEKEAAAPMYEMVDSWEERHTSKNRLQADQAIGTVAMRARGWMDVSGYHEELEGYGCDDGDLWQRIGASGIARRRSLGVYHIAHQAGTTQQEAHTPGDKARGTRSDHWGRAEGLNPNRLRENRRIAGLSRWRSEAWGRP